MKTAIYVSNWNAAGITAVANVNLNTMEADAVLGDLKAKLLDGTVYISYQDLKIKAAADELSSVIDRFAPLSEGVGILSAFDEIDAETLLNEIIGDCHAKEENGILSLGLLRRRNERSDKTLRRRR